jgi:tetratricopeptide (TPR) repeat protein
MQEDARGLLLTTRVPEAARACDAALDGLLKYRLDAPAHLDAALRADPEAPMPHILRGGMALLASKAAYVPVAEAALAAAAPALRRATERERAHAAAIEAWIADDLDRALAIWEQILAQYPRDLLALGLHHACAFWLGRPRAMLAAAEGVAPYWDAQVPGWGNLLACRAFANEECDDLALAESLGREAVALDPADLWAVHAVAHVMEAEGRRAEGIAWVREATRHVAGTNNLRHHVFWHQALYHLERREFDAVLDLYDRGFRDLDSDLTQAEPDLYIDMQNAISILFRLRRLGIDPGDRWVELADKAEGRIGDGRSAFSLPHWMMALTADGRFDAARWMLRGMRDIAESGGGTTAGIIGHVGLPVSEAVLLHAEGAHAQAVAVMRPALDGMPALGGSHAQQDVLAQLFLDAALKAGMEADARMLLRRIAANGPVPLEQRVGYAEAARALRF